MEMKQPLVRPLMTIKQLAQNTSRYIFGCGMTASSLMSLLDQNRQANITFVDLSNTVSVGDKPVIGMREFLARSLASDPVIYAADNLIELSLLTAAGQQDVLTVSEYVLSHFHGTSLQKQGLSRLAFVSTMPRAGTHRILYFFFALNEILKNPSRMPDPLKLYLYYRADSFANDSPYCLNHVWDFLNVDRLQTAHLIPPASLAAQSTNPVLAQWHYDWWQNYADLCCREPALAGITHYVRAFEPFLGYGKTYQTRCAFVSRDIITQIISILTTYELMVTTLRNNHVEDWSLHNYVDYCIIQPKWSYQLDSILPLILYRTISEKKTITDILFNEGYIDNLIFDYAWRLFSVQSCVDNPSTTLVARIFHYEDLIREEQRFFCGLIEFLRGSPLEENEIRQVDRARVTTGRDQHIEAKLGHSLSYLEGATTPISLESHMTDISSRENARNAVASKVLFHRPSIQRKLVKALQDMGLKREPDFSIDAGDKGRG